MGHASSYSSQAQCAGVSGVLELSKDNAGTKNSFSSAGKFLLNFDDYSPYTSSTYTHYLGGTYSQINGDITSYPTNSVIAAVIGRDKISSSSTFAGYFIGRTYFSENVGIGTTEASAKLQVTDGDIYISDIEKGIILKSPDENCWRGTVSNEGNLEFSAVTCPDESADASSVSKYESVSEYAPLKEANTDKLEASSQKISIYPNPAKELISINLDGLEDTNELKYEIYTTNGILRDANTLLDSNTKLDISDLTSGSYIVKVINTNGDLLSVTQFIKQ